MLDSISHYWITKMNNNLEANLLVHILNFPSIKIICFILKLNGVSSIKSGLK